MDTTLIAGIKPWTFDREWYEIQVGKRFAGKREALRDYLLRRGQRVSPHPLFEPDYLPGRIRDLGHYLQSEEQSPHPMFDTTKTDLTWSQWLKQAKPDTEVPVPDQVAPIRWGALRTLLMDTAKEWKAGRSRMTQEKRTLLDKLPDAPTLPPLPADQEPLVSVIMATWNRAAVVGNAVNSIQAQQYQNWELIIVDDGSSDSTVADMQRRAEADPRIKVLARPHRGQSPARNDGIAVASGKYLAFIDSDNTWRPEFLAVMVATMEGKRWRVAYAAMIRHSPTSSKIRATSGDRELLFHFNFIDMNVIVVERELAQQVGGFDESLPRAEDYDFALNLTKHADAHLVGVVGADYSAKVNDEYRVIRNFPNVWDAKVRAKHMFDWDADARRERQAGLVSLILPQSRSLLQLLERLNLIDQLPGWELVVPGVGSRAQICCLRALCRDKPVQVVSRRVENHPMLCSIGFIESHGATVVFARAGSQLDAEVLRRVAAAVQDPAVAVAQPVDIAANGHIASVGALFVADQPTPWPGLRGLDPALLDGLGETPVPAALASVVATKAATYRALQGFDPLFGNNLAETDFSLRAAAAGAGITVLEPDCQVRFVLDEERFGFHQDLAVSLRFFTANWPQPPPGSDEFLARLGLQITGYDLTPAPGTPHPTRPTDVITLHLGPQPTDSATMDSPT
jgi:GT2 family glycosyltransferase